MNTGPTQFQNINKVIADLASRITQLLGDNLVGVYLFGSLTYGDFNPKRSDIDLMIVVHTSLTAHEIEQVKAHHNQVEGLYPEWNERVEASYTPIGMLNNIMPPAEPRPYFGEGKMWNEARYGNEWLINLYLLHKHGVTVYGRNFHELVSDVDITEVQKACIRDLFQEWEPKLNEPEWLNNSHYQSYLALNLCRILYTVMNFETDSKTLSTGWVKQKFPEWQLLLQAAEDWHYGIELNKQDQTLNFLKFVIEKVNNFTNY